MKTTTLRTTVVTLWTTIGIALSMGFLSQYSTNAAILVPVFAPFVAGLVVGRPSRKTPAKLLKFPTSPESAEQKNVG